MRTKTDTTGQGRTPMRVVLAGLLAGSISLTMAGCAQQGDGNGLVQSDGSGSHVRKPSVTALLKSEAEIPTDGSPLSLIDTADIWSKRDLESSYADSEATTILIDGADVGISGANASSVSTSEGTITISEEGTYVLSGQSNSMGVVVDAPADAKVQLVLAGVSLANDGGACLHAKSADKVFLTVKDGTKNSLMSTGGFVTDGDVDGTVFSKADLTVNGTGELSVTSSTGNGIVGKDEVTLASSTTTIDAPQGHAIDANDCVAIHDGSWNLRSGKDGIHAENSDDQTKGWVYADGGTISIVAGTDGIDAGSQIQIDGGTFALECGDDGIHAELDLAINGGAIDVTKCVEGIEGGTVTVTAGAVSVVSDDDGINATGTPNASEDDATNGTVNVRSPQDEGNGSDGQQVRRQPPDTDGERPAMPDGEAPADMGASGSNRPSPSGMPGGMEPHATADDKSGTSSDGTDASANASGHPGATEDSESQEQRPQVQDGGQRPGGIMGGGFGMMDADSTALLTISGGHVTIDAKGDGIDCNGLIHVTGGQTCVYGPDSDGNSAMDYGTDFRIDGGELMAVGSSGMVEDVSPESKQASMTVFLGENVTGDVSISVGDSSVVECSPTRRYSMILVSTPAMRDDGTYEIKTGDKTTPVQMDGRVTVSGTRSSFTGGEPRERAGSQPGEFSSPEGLVGQRMGVPREPSEG